MFRAVAIANRGEIAVRVVRTLRAMGIRSVVMFTDPDRDSVHVRVADEAVHIGGPFAYLDVDAVVAAAVRAGADALHPGYGFLSENAALAEACESAGITFVGPPAAAIRAMSDKINAKQLVSTAGVPVVPGKDGRSLDDAALETAAVEMGLPVLIKPSAGGGGKGMHRVDREADLLDAIATARREAVAAFGDGTLLVERFVERPRHIEIQVLADTHGQVVALGERECSLQRRHQKIIEESPSPLLGSDIRAAMESAAVSAAKACGYTNAGTVEFIVSADRPDEFFFMEMNTRLQVEHPVTEMVRNMDLVECQLRVAAGEHLPWADQASVPPARGHAVEARVYAEDPGRAFLPAAGTVRAFREPSAPGIRVDSGVFQSSMVGTSYDPMLAKVIAWAPGREQALGRLHGALAKMAIVGVGNNIGFLRRLLDQPRVVAGDLDTELVDQVHEAIARPPGGRWVPAASALLSELLDAPAIPGPWEVRDGWRLAGPSPRVSRWKLNGEAVEVSLTGIPGSASTVAWDGGGPLRAGVRLEADRMSLELGDELREVIFAAEGDRIWMSHDGDSWELSLERGTIDHAGPARAGAGPVISPMPGTVLAVHVTTGEKVTTGQALVTVEAMKMEHVVPASIDGMVAKVLVLAGDPVSLGQPLAEVVPEEEEASAGDRPS
ncbi:MAG TPA: biotin carboxylase N-terminal domain-containing protein [Acidimicrobiales bacterium]|nr:biotin carboxylase N-terminal domain-containing protein [Acidimicrobiales bacterium]